VALQRHLVHLLTADVMHLRDELGSVAHDVGLALEHFEEGVAVNRAVFGQGLYV
jgi:hypothetical protein